MLVAGITTGLFASQTLAHKQTNYIVVNYPSYYLGGTNKGQFEAGLGIGTQANILPRFGISIGSEASFNLNVTPSKHQSYLNTMTAGDFIKFDALKTKNFTTGIGTEIMIQQRRVVTTTTSKGRTGYVTKYKTIYNTGPAAEGFVYIGNSKFQVRLGLESKILGDHNSNNYARAVGSLNIFF